MLYHLCNIIFELLFKLIRFCSVEVRGASIDSMCELALYSISFAQLSIDFLVDMFNDEIESVRENAIYSLRAIAHLVCVRDDQLEIILGVLKVCNMSNF